MSLTGGNPGAQRRSGWQSCLAHNLHALAGIGIVVGGLTACGASIGLPKESEHEAVAMKNASVVLLRLVATTKDGKPVNVLGRMDLFAVWTGDFFVLAENIDTGEQVTVVRPRSPTPEAEMEGWMYLVLAPGRYQVIVKPWPEGPASRRFFLALPAAGGVVYAGSLPITCEAAWTFTPATGWPRCEPPSNVTDESDSAAKIAHTMLQEYGPLLTSLLR